MDMEFASTLGQNAYNTITNLLLGAITFICCLFANILLFDFGNNSLGQHIILNVLGYILVMPQAVMTFSSSNGWTRTLSHDNKRSVHLVLQMIGSALVISGSIIRMQGVPGSNFRTVHGVFGLLSFIMTILTLIGGIGNYFNKSTNRQGKFIRISHATAGCLTLIFAFITLILGLNRILFRSWVDNSGANLMIAMVIFALIGVISSAISKRVRT